MFAATIRFRWEMAILADYIVRVFELPVPIAALVKANKPDDETMAIIAIEQFMEAQKEFHEQRACQDERVRVRGREWLKTIGR
ncbi:hypothetical protein N7536_009154 [Penicillium majusculum]|nr:hypothetical protein N7536_009154 [Penicillium majusculum]